MTTATSAPPPGPLGRTTSGRSSPSGSNLRSKFCVVMEELLLHRFTHIYSVASEHEHEQHSRWLRDHSLWEELLLLKVDSAWLRSLLDKCTLIPTAQQRHPLHHHHEAHIQTQKQESQHPSGWQSSSSSPAHNNRSNTTKTLNCHVETLHRLLERLSHSISAPTTTTTKTTPRSQIPNSLSATAESVADERLAMDGGSVHQSANTDFEQSVRQKHALKILGVVLRSVCERDFVDFTDNVLHALCLRTHTERFFLGLLDRLVGCMVPVRFLDHVISTRARSSSRGDDEDDESRRSEIVSRGIRALDGDELKIQSIATEVLLVLVGACENLQQNTMLDFVCSAHVKVSIALEFTMSTSRSAATYESALAILALVFNYRKYEVRNPFAKQRRVQTQSQQLSSLHTLAFALESVLVACISDLENKGRVRGEGGGGEGSSGVVSSTAEALFTWAENSTRSMLAVGTSLTTGFGAWMIGMSSNDEDNQAQDDESINNKKKNRRGMWHQHGSRIFGDSSTMCVTTQSSDRVPMLTMSVNCVRCPPMRWVRVRLALLCVYELFCNDGDQGMGIAELVSHNVMPWSVRDRTSSINSAQEGNSKDNHSMAIPVACPSVVNQALTLVSFCLHSGNGPVVKVALIVLQCLLEHRHGAVLLFATSLENDSGIQSLHVYERNTPNGKLTLGKAVASSTSYGTKVKGAANAARDKILSRDRSSSSNVSGVGGMARQADTSSLCLAVAVYRQVAMVLRTVAANHKNNSSSGSGVFDAGLAQKALEVLQRMLVHDRRHNQQQHQRSGVEWPFVVDSVLSLLQPIVDNSNHAVNAVVVDVGLSKLLVRVLNLFIVVLPPRPRHLLFYELVRQRAALETWRRLLEACVRNHSTGHTSHTSSASSSRVGSPTSSSTSILSPSSSSSQSSTAAQVLHELSNVRAVVSHLSAAVSLEMGEGGSTTLAAIEANIASSEKTLQLKAYDGRWDVYQPFVENPHEAHVFRAFLRQLLADRHAALKPRV